MCFCVPADQADGLLIIHTEELEFLAVHTALFLGAGRWSLTHLLSQLVRQVSQRQVTWWLIPHRKHLLTDGARLISTLFPPFLETGFAEAVAARQHHRLPVNVAAHRASAVLPGIRRAGGHSLSSVFSFTAELLPSSINTQRTNRGSLLKTYCC